MRLRRITRHLLIILVTVLLGGFLAATLVRMAPGSGSDERQLDSRLRKESLEALRHTRDDQRNIVSFYAQYVGGLFRGDLGVSQSLGRPIAELLAERVPLT